MWNLFKYYIKDMKPTEKIELYMWIALLIFDGILMIYILYRTVLGY